MLEGPHFDPEPSPSHHRIVIVSYVPPYDNAASLDLLTAVGRNGIPPLAMFRGLNEILPFKLSIPPFKFSMPVPNISLPFGIGG